MTVLRVTWLSNVAGSSTSAWGQTKRISAARSRAAGAIGSIQPDSETDAAALVEQLKVGDIVETSGSKFKYWLPD
jgi:hypothetical protein